jgi:endo-1,4-beta-mannosidase
MKFDTMKALVLTAIFSLFMATAAQANGPIGDHVNDLQAHLDEYSEEVLWLIEQVEEIVGNYERGGLANTNPERVVEIWEEVNFHAAIETNYVPVYASIWQGLFGVRQAIEGEQPIADVRAAQVTLEQSFWQGLGAVKVAAQFQARGLVANIEDTEPTSPVETLTQIGQLLDRVVAKYAERLPEEAVSIVYDTYLSRFEGVEGDLIEQDADLVEDLEIDFNVNLPQAIENGSTVEQVRSVVNAMQSKLNRARNLLEEAEANRSSVF